VSRWQELNPEHQYVLYDAGMRRSLIRKNFDRHTLEAYDRLIPGAFKCDLWRYCILFLHGGIYADLDTIPLKPVNEFVHDSDDLVLCIDLNRNPENGCHNMSNAFMAVPPHHRITEIAIEIALSRVLHGAPYLSRLDFTGPGVWGRAFNRLLDRPEDSSVVQEPGRKVLNGYRFNLLKSRLDDGYMVDSDGNALLQNKHGSPELKKISTPKKRSCLSENGPVAA
jgi:mannosyltransferase OCH1-like enzyme